MSIKQLRTLFGRSVDTVAPLIVAAVEFVGAVLYLIVAVMFGLAAIVAGCIAAIAAAVGIIAAAVSVIEGAAVLKYLERRDQRRAAKSAATLRKMLSQWTAERERLQRLRDAFRVPATKYTTNGA